MDDLLELLDAATLNLIEAGFWMSIALIVAVRTRRGSRELRRIGFFVALSLVVFGVSDLIESRTGAWYEPWWLLMLKAACVIALLGCFVCYSACRRHTHVENEPPH